eukprot:m.197350 g.197350  ORF g.197350 m.197350 type:complete len:247 (+) comp13682_c0_seq1:128-868(+)
MGGKSSKVVMEERLERSAKTGVLALQGLGLTQIPSKVMELNKLRSISLAANNLAELPSELSRLKDLKTLQLESNSLRDLPSEYTSMKKMEKIFLQKNRFTAMPFCVLSFSKLKQLNISHNKLTSIPPEVFQLKKLEVINVSFNQISVIPDAVGECQAIELNVNGNNIKQLPIALKDSNLKVLRCENNKLTVKGIPPDVLRSSSICLLELGDSNAITQSQFQDIDGYKEYSERFTSNKKKGEKRVHV